jgi:hypothetical protein
MAERGGARERFAHHLRPEAKRAGVRRHRERSEQQGRPAPTREDRPQADRRKQFPLVVLRDEREPRRRLAALTQPLAGL